MPAKISQRFLGHIIMTFPLHPYLKGRSFSYLDNSFDLFNSIFITPSLCVLFYLCIFVTTESLKFLGYTHGL